jgi:hypothetical protein
MLTRFRLYLNVCLPFSPYDALAFSGVSGRNAILSAILNLHVEVLCGWTGIGKSGSGPGEQRAARENENAFKKARRHNLSRFSHSARSLKAGALLLSRCEAPGDRCGLADVSVLHFTISCVCRPLR